MYCDILQDASITEVKPTAQSIETTTEVKPVETQQSKPPVAQSIPPATTREITSKTVAEIEEELELDLENIHIDENIDTSVSIYDKMLI